MLNGEEHISKIAHITTLAGYVHYMLTGVNAIGVGEASGMFPIDSETLGYDKRMLEQFRGLAAVRDLPWDVEEILPGVLTAGEKAFSLSGLPQDVFSAVDSGLNALLDSAGVRFSSAEFTEDGLLLK